MIASIVLAVMPDPAATVQGQIIVTLKTNVFDAMKTESEKQQTMKVSEVKSIRFQFDNTLFEVPFTSRQLFESVTNMVKSETWTPKMNVPPLPVNTPMETRFVTNARYATPQVPASHPNIPR